MDLAKALSLIKEFEGCILHAYLDSVGVPTIGWGHTRNVHMGMSCSQIQADSWLKEDLDLTVEKMLPMIKVKINHNEFCALADFCFNLGTGTLYHSQLLTYLNAGRTVDASKQILRFDHAGGKRLPGLTRRRIAEYDLFTSLA